MKSDLSAAKIMVAAAELPPRIALPERRTDCQKAAKTWMTESQGERVKGARPILRVQSNRFQSFEKRLHKKDPTFVYYGKSGVCACFKKNIEA